MSSKIPTCRRVTKRRRPSSPTEPSEFNRRRPSSPTLGRLPTRASLINRRRPSSPTEPSEFNRRRPSSPTADARLQVPERVPLALAPDSPGSSPTPDRRRVDPDGHPCRFSVDPDRGGVDRGGDGEEPGGGPPGPAGTTPDLVVLEPDETEHRPAFARLADGRAGYAPFGGRVGFPGPAEQDPPGRGHVLVELGHVDGLVLSDPLELHGQEPADVPEDRRRG